MPQSRSEASNSRDISLHIAASPEAVWQSVILPWVQTVAPRVPENRAAVAVVVPFRSHAYLLRNKLLAHGMSLLGVKFLLPAQLRELLQPGGKTRVPLREHLRLLLSWAAEQCAAAFQKENESNEFHIAKAVALEPDRFLHAIDAVAAANARFSAFTSSALADIAIKFKGVLDECGCLLLPEADRRLLQAEDPAQPRFSHLLVTGFDAAHWPLWPLLRAAVSAAQQATIILHEPRYEAGELDRIWVSTWEEHFGAAERIPALVTDLDPRFGCLLTVPQSASDITARKQQPLDNIHFIVGHDTTQQARAIVTLALAFAAEPECQSVAILLPGAGALARLVANGLEQLNVPHNDSIAHQRRGVFDTEEWRAWLELQARPQLEPLLRFLEHSAVAISFFAGLSLRKIQNTLRRACGDILINALDVIREYCRLKQEELDYDKLAAGLGMIHFLPENATFKEFRTTTTDIFRALKWTEREAELNRLASGWSERFNEPLAREYFLRWLAEIFAESSISRDACGDHPYARIQLLRYNEAELGSWSHVILGGLNEGVWPPREQESPFLSEETIAAINRHNVMESIRFGAGQAVVREAATLCVGAGDRRTLALRQLLNVIESTRQAIGVVAERYTTTPREQALNPSDFFARLFFSARGEALSQDDIAEIETHTHEWLTQRHLFQQPKPNTAEVKQTEIAYRARRRPDREFDEYEFTLRKDSPPQQQIALSATDVGNLLQRPALVWLKVFLGVAAEELNTESWSLATGQWVHRWLASIGAPSENHFVPRPSADEIVSRVAAAADNFRRDIVAILRACGRTREPDWWLSGWLNARYLAAKFAEQIAATKEWPRLATEWQLDSPQVIEVARGQELFVRGRLDLILATAEDAGSIWIIDYKTGEAEPLSSSSDKFRKQLIGGQGVQISIYALSLRGDFRDIYASLLTRSAKLEPQVSLSDVLGTMDFWKEIARIEKTGIFGMLGEVRSKFEFTGTYPLATLSIDKHLLREKWERTHPAFARNASK